jgi:hypothetical protein
MLRLLKHGKWNAPPAASVIPRAQAAHDKPGKKRLGAEQRRALELLASIPHGATKALLLAYGFRPEMLRSSCSLGSPQWRAKP